MQRPLPRLASVPAAVLLLALAALNPLPVRGQESPGDGDAAIASGEMDRAAPFRAGTRSAVAVARTGPVRVDGRLDEEAWEAAPVFSGFIQKEPHEGSPAREDTEVRVLFDDEALYIGAILLDSEPERISRQLLRRDQEGSADFFEVSIDPNLDRRTGYQFTVSAANVQVDRYLFDDNREDGAWNAVWSSEVHHAPWGWSVEIRIPLSQVRFDPVGGAQTWGVNFSRRRTATNERSYFSPESRAVRGVVSRFGLLDGLEVGAGARRIEARPYILARGTRGPARDGDPFFDGGEAGARVGMDLRYGLGSAFTVDATVNPDFGQVEADPATINLTAFETFLSERRPFFVEDARILDFSLSGGQNTLFYSRRIGRAPQGGAPSGASFVDMPDAATILGAVKLTGRTRSGLSLGALGAVTGAAEGRAFFSGEGRRERFLAEPGTRYGVVRAQQDFRQGESVVGAIVTGLQRDLPAGGSFDWLPEGAFSAGIDFEHTWSDRDWALHGFLAGSHVVGDSTAMIRIQRASNHYFQRPDALRLSVDSTATSMSGVEWRLQLERRNGRNWNGSVWAAQVTPGFEVNDLGYGRSAERLDGGARISYRDLEPGRHLRSWNANLSTFHNVSHEVLEDPGSWRAWRAAHVSGSVNASAGFTFLNYWNLNVDLRVSPDVSNRTATRGGPLVREPGSVGGGIRLGSDGRRSVTIRPSLNLSRGRADSGTELRTSMEVALRPSPRVELQVEPSWSRSSDGAQYVGTSRTVPWEATFGPRYLFGSLERETLSMQTRLNVAFTPALTLQLFAQPFLSSGAYVRFRQLEGPGTYAFVEFPEGEHGTVAGAAACTGGRTCVDGAGRRHLDFDGDGLADHSLSDPDFVVRSLRGNAVLRWEYRPGSTLFLVWQQQRASEGEGGRLDMGRDLGALAGGPADNVLIVKVNYWFGL